MYRYKLVKIADPESGQHYLNVNVQEFDAANCVEYRHLGGGMESHWLPLNWVPVERHGFT